MNNSKPFNTLLAVVVFFYDASYERQQRNLSTESLRITYYGSPNT